LAKSKATSMGLSVASQLLGLGQIGDVAANLGTQLLTLKYGRDDETEADLVGLEIAARAGFKPEASVQLWKKMLGASGGGKGQPSFLSTHPSGNNRIQELEANLPKVAPLYAQAVQGREAAPLN
jgi:predicted Zn-dependent protease